MCSCDFMEAILIGRKTFDQKVRDLSAEYGIYEIPQISEIMGIPLPNAEKLIDPLMARNKQPTPWFQKMFLELYKQKLERFEYA